MSVKLRDARDSHADREWIRAAYSDYLGDLSSSRSGLFPVLGDWTVREDDFLLNWFNDSATHPFVIVVDGACVCFALVTQLTARSGRSPGYRMSDFFVTRNARGRGIGRSAAALLFSRFVGEWEVREDESNRSALDFWRRVIGAHTQGRYSEARGSGEVCHRFRSSVHPAAAGS
jgi:predicted acetyltransferase